MSDIEIAGRLVGNGHPTYVVAEISANHGGRFERAKDLVLAAAAAGADAVKLQTYTADTMTIDSDADPFRIAEGTLWAGRTLYDLYADAHTPWEWHRPLLDLANQHGLTLFSSPFDHTAVAFLDAMGVPVMKIASFELVDPELIRTAAATGRPIILSTGMASEAEIEAGIAAARGGGATSVALLRCNSAYPAPAEEMDLRTIPDMAERWGVPIGFSDHTLGTTASVVAVALGASMIEKHLTISREEPTADAAFSLEPYEFRGMVDEIRAVEAMSGQVRYGPSPRERSSLAFRRSLFVVEDVAAGERFTERNVRVIRPGQGLPPRHLPEILGKPAARSIARGTPLSWADVHGGIAGSAGESILPTV